MSAPDAQSDYGRLRPTPDTTPAGGLDWRSGMDELDRLLDDCAQDGLDYKHRVRVDAVRYVVAAIRRFEEDVDESVGQAAWEDAVTAGEAWAREESSPCQCGSPGTYSPNASEVVIHRADAPCVVVASTNGVA
jgi:hypothetical protein